jgi:hypothetical protein
MKLILQALFVLAALGMAGLNLHGAHSTQREGRWDWMRYCLVVTHIWAAVALLIGAIMLGGLQ